MKTEFTGFNNQIKTVQNFEWIFPNLRQNFSKLQKSKNSIMGQLIDSFKDIRYKTDHIIYKTDQLFF